MALDKDILGQDLHDARQSFNDQTMDELIATYGSLDAVRLAMAKADAGAIINHFKTNAIIIPAMLLAPEHAGPVTGTGTIE